VHCKAVPLHEFLYYFIADLGPIDVFILRNSSLLSKSVISCHPVGVLLTEDQGGIDPKVIAVPLTKIDPIFSAIRDIKDIQENVRTQLKHFIEHHKDLEEGKYVKLLRWEGKDAAKILISEAIKQYNKSIDV